MKNPGVKKFFQNKINSKGEVSETTASRDIHIATDGRGEFKVALETVKNMVTVCGRVGIL